MITRSPLDERASTGPADGARSDLADWLSFSSTKIGADLERTAGELRDVVRRSREDASVRFNIGGDARAPVHPATGAPLSSFDTEIRAGNRIQRSVELGTVVPPVETPSNMLSVVGHAGDKVAKRNAANVPVPGEHEVTIQITLSKGYTNKKGVTQISPNGDRATLTREDPPRRIPLRNMFDEFTDKIPKSPNHELLDRIAVVQFDTGALLAEYARTGKTWRRIR